jgi:hypothetical protein
MTFCEVFSVNSTASLVTVSDVGRLDLRTPFEELTELREVLSVNEIAEMTGLRRETLSRARPDSRFQQRTAKGLHDLLAVVTRLRPMVDGDVHLAAVLRRPQPEFARRSIARMVREGHVDIVLEQLARPEPTDPKELENLELPPEIVAELEAEHEGARPKPLPAQDSTLAARISALLAADPELSSRLPEIEAKVREHFGSEARIERKIIEPYDIPGGRDQFYLGVRTDLSVAEAGDRLGDLLEQEHDLLGPVVGRLTIGFL